LVRTLASKLTDQFLLTYLLNDLSRRTGFIYETKMHKLAFISEREMVNNCEKGFNYYFIKLYHGPYSFELNDDLNDFAQSEIIVTEPSDKGTTIIPTEKCTRILSDFGSLARRNRVFLRRIDHVNRRYGTLGLTKLLNAVYHMQSPLHEYEKQRRPPTIASLPLRAPLIKAISDEVAKTAFSITREEIATLEIYFDKEAFDSLTQASESAKKEHLLNSHDVF